MDLLAIALAALAVAVLVLMHRRRRRQVKRERGAFFERCMSLFEAARIAQDDVDFPVLEGRYRGFAVRLEPIVDHVAVRKLPSLWLLVTLREPLPLAGVTDFLARPLNTEFYSPAIHLDHRLATPAGFPETVQVRTDRPDRQPPAERLRPYGVLFGDPRMKELIIGPRGVRLVYQVAEGERAHYMVLRQAEFGGALALDPALARSLLDHAIAIRDELQEAA
jgi:hypothetical protein